MAFPIRFSLRQYGRIYGAVIRIVVAVRAVIRGRNHHTTITWNTSASPEVVGYNIYRGEAKENPSPVAKLAASECRKKAAPKREWDEDDYDVVSGAKHCYVVKAVLRSGNVLDRASEEACAATPCACGPSIVLKVPDAGGMALLCAVPAPSHETLRRLCLHAWHGRAS